MEKLKKVCFISVAVFLLSVTVRFASYKLWYGCAMGAISLLIGIVICSFQKRRNRFRVIPILSVLAIVLSLFIIPKDDIMGLVAIVCIIMIPVILFEYGNRVYYLMYTLIAIISLSSIIYLNMDDSIMKEAYIAKAESTEKTVSETTKIESESEVESELETKTFESEENNDEIKYLVNDNTIIVTPPEGYEVTSNPEYYVIGNEITQVISVHNDENSVIIEVEASGKNAKLLLCNGLFKNENKRSEKLEIDIK